jgi:hypothetical protein
MFFVIFTNNNNRCQLLWIQSRATVITGTHQHAIHKNDGNSFGVSRTVFQLVFKEAEVKHTLSLVIPPHRRKADIIYRVGGLLIALIRRIGGKAQNWCIVPLRHKCQTGSRGVHNQYVQSVPVGLVGWKTELSLELWAFAHCNSEHTQPSPAVCVWHVLLGSKRGRRTCTCFSLAHNNLPIIHCRAKLHSG